MILCDICHILPAIVDGKTIMRSWAYMCKDCFPRYGIPVTGLYTYLPSEMVAQAEATITPVRVNKAPTSNVMQTSNVTHVHTKGGKT